MKTVETENEMELLEALEEMVEQACGMDDSIDSMAITAYAGGMRLLAEYGRLKIIGESGRRVVGEWVK